jgi:hypothetical protein
MNYVSHNNSTDGNAPSDRPFNCKVELCQINFQTANSDEVQQFYIVTQFNRHGL